MSDKLNRGFIDIPPGPDDFVLGGEREATKNTMQSNRDWSEYLPVKELQHSEKFDTWGCVSFSRNNCIEIMMNKMFGLKVNLSDRFMAKVSGTVPGRGNNLSKVAQAGRENGGVAEKIYPFDGNNIQEYYKEIPPLILENGKSLLSVYEFQYDWVDWNGCNPRKLWDALEYAPLQVSVFFGGPQRNGIYLRSGNPPNHAVTLFKGEYKKYWWIFDQYEGVIKKLAWNFYFGSAMRHSIVRKQKNRLLKASSSPKVYSVGNDEKKRHIADEMQFEVGREMGLWGDWDTIRTVEESELSKREEGNSILI